MIKRIVSNEFNRLIRYYQENEDFDVETEKGSGKKRVEVTVEPGFTKLFINIGKMDGVNPKALLGMINDCVETKAEVGRIDLFTRYSLFDVADAAADEVIEQLNTLRLRGRNIRVYAATQEQISRGTKDRKEEQEGKRGHREGRGEGQIQGRSDGRLDDLWSERRSDRKEKKYRK